MCLFGFTGRAFDQTTGLQDNWHRKYDAETGGWMSKDPMGVTAGDTNTSRYCGNNLTNGIDPNGMWLIKSPTTPAIHEFITYKAALVAGYATDGTGETWSLEKLKDKDFGRGLQVGVEWVDAPNGLDAVAYLYLYTEKVYELQNNPGFAETIASHFGDLQYRHAMTPHKYPTGDALKWSAEDMQREIVNWICTQYQKALDARELVWKEVPSIQPPGTWTPGTLYSYYEPTKISGLELGKALHTLEDLYCASHVWRSSDGGQTKSPSAPIYSFQDYALQNQKEHKKADTWVSFNNTTNTPTWPTGYVAACYQQAVAMCAELLRMFKNGTPVASIENVVGVREWLLNGPLALAPDAKVGPADPNPTSDSNVGKVTGPATALQNYRALV